MCGSGFAAGGKSASFGSTGAAAVRGDSPLP